MNNVVKLNGNLVSEPISSLTTKGKAVANFRVAVTRDFPGVGSDFISCTAFSDNADIIKDVKVGTPLVITGCITTNNYEKDGKKHYNTYVLVRKLELA